LQISQGYFLFVEIIAVKLWNDKEIENPLHDLNFFFTRKQSNKIIDYGD